MPKTKTRAKSKTSHTTSSTPVEHEGEKVISAYYARGERVNALRKSKGYGRQQAAAEDVSEHGSSVDRAKKASLFVDAFKAGIPEWLLELFRAGDREPIKVTHLELVLGIEDNELKRKWLVEAHTNGWSTRRLRDEIKKKGEGPGSSGRRPYAKPSDLGKTLDGLIARSNDWLTQHEQIWSAETSWPPAIKSDVDTPEALIGRVKEAGARLRCLGRAALLLGDRLEVVETFLRQIPRTNAD